MITLALDQASRTTGWAIFEDDNLKDYGHFTITDENLGVRLKKIKEKVIKLLNDHNVERVVFEDIQEQNNIAVFKALAEVYGVLELTFTELKMPYETIGSSSWKSVCGIKGKKRPEQKKNAIAHVEQVFKIKPTSDEADAICIGESQTKNNWAVQ